MNAFPVDIQCLRYGQFDGTENKRDVYRGEDCMKKIFESLREHAMKQLRKLILKRKN